MSDISMGEQHCIFGAGLIGCYLGGVLAHLGFETQLVCRTATKVKLLNGLTLSDYQAHQSHVQHVKVVDEQQLQNSLFESLQTRFLWLTVKCTGVEQACLDMAALIDKDTIIFCCQNGLGSDAIVKKHFPDNLVLRVMVPFNVVEMSPGHYHRGSEGQMTIEQTSQSETLVNTLVSSIHSALLPVTSSQHMQALLWAKLQLNLGNSVNALADIPVKAMLEQRNYRKVIALLMEELLQVVDTLEISLPKVTSVSAHKIPWVLRLPNFIFKRLANKMLAIDPNVRSSMWWDVSQGKATEIEHLNGAIIQHAQTLNIPCPANQKICELIRGLSTATNKTSRLLPPLSADLLLKTVGKS